MCEFDLRVLRYFVAVAEELHFGRAARRLHITQPALSVQVRKLERLLDTRLLERTSRHVALTGAGEVLLDEARRLLVGAERASEAVRAAARGASADRLVVGFFANGAAELTPEIVSLFQEQHPGVRLQMRQFDFGDPYAGLEDGAVDVAFVRPPLAAQAWLAMETLFHEPRVLCVSDANALARRERLTMADLVDEHFVARRAPGYWRDFWLAADARDGVEPRIGAEVTNVDECFAAILADRGVALTQASTQRFYGRPGMAFVPVDGVAASTAAIAWRRDNVSPQVVDFVATARSLALEGPCVPQSVAPAESALVALAS